MRPPGDGRGTRKLTERSEGISEGAPPAVAQAEREGGLLSRRPPRPAAGGPVPRGLTLVELLVAMAILVTVTGSTMLIFRGITQAWRKGQLRTDRYQQVRLLFNLFAREVSSCVVNPRFPLVGTDAGQGSPLKSGSASDELFFVGALPGRGGLVERGYRLDAKGQFLCHDEEPADGDYVATGTEEPCASDVVAFDAAYFNGTQWLTTWDGRPGGAQAAQAPKAIRITLTIGAQEKERFETVIRIPTS